MANMFGDTGYVDPEIKAMQAARADRRHAHRPGRNPPPTPSRAQDTIHGAIDLSYDERNRAKEGSTSFGGTYYRGPTGRSKLTFKLYALSTRLELPRAASKQV